MTPVEKMREAAKEVARLEQANATDNDQLATAFRIYTRICALPAEAPEPTDEFPPFKPCRLDNPDSSVTEWMFEDVAHVARPAFPGTYHFIDELIAMDGGRLVGVQFWGPVPKPPEPTDAVRDAAAKDLTIARLVRALNTVTLKWNETTSQLKTSETERDDAIASAFASSNSFGKYTTERDAMRDALGMAEKAMVKLHHSLTTLHNLRATDLTVKEFDKILASQTPRENIEWMTDTSSDCHTIDRVLAAIRKALGET